MSKLIFYILSLFQKLFMLHKFKTLKINIFLGKIFLLFFILLILFRPIFKVWIGAGVLLKI